MAVAVAANFILEGRDLLLALGTGIVEDGKSSCNGLVELRVSEGQAVNEG